MTRLKPRLNAPIVFLMTGLCIGFGAGFFVAPARALRALSPDSADNSLLMSCIVSMEYNDARKVQTPVEGLVYLDYRRGRLVGTMPELRQIGQQSKYLSNFTERDLVEDFQIEPGTTPRFMMSAIAAGAMTDGGQLLVVLDTQSRQTRVYKFSYQQAGVEFKPQFSLVEKKVFDSKTNVEQVRPATFHPFNKP
jgi:hypothetical protein